MSKPTTTETLHDCAWDKILLARHPKRPKSVDIIHNVCDEFVELSGDKLFADDAAVIGGLARIGDQNVVIIGQEKGSDTSSRILRNFGMMQPEGFRKALRLMKLAEKFTLPVVCLIDTPGAYPGLEAEQRGQAWAIAENLKQMSLLKVPICVVIVGEGCSGGALGMAVGDWIGMMENAYYSVISPEGCASILFKDSKKSRQAAASLRLTAKDMLEFSIIDEILEEPSGGFHDDPQTTYKYLKEKLAHQLQQFKVFNHQELIEKRYQKFRVMGILEENGS